MLGEVCLTYIKAKQIHFYIFIQNYICSQSSDHSVTYFYRYKYDHYILLTCTCTDGSKTTTVVTKKTETSSSSSSTKTVSGKKICLNLLFHLPMSVFPYL